MKVRIENWAFEPTRAHAEDAGLDLYSPVDMVLYPRGSAVIDTGVHVQLPPGTCGLLVSKSGLNTNHDITSTGLIDEGFTGSIRVKLYNHGNDPYTISRGNKISQLAVLPVQREPVEIVDELDAVENGRGDNGFGSTGR